MNICFTKAQAIAQPAILLIGLVATLLTLASCEGTLNERVGKVTETIKKVDSASFKVSRGLTEFTKQVEGYVDTTAYKKDSTGIWHAEKDSFLLQQQQ